MAVFDFYVDEDKQNRKLGVSAVSNAVALNQILESIRHQYGLKREIKWGEMDRFRLPVAVAWIRVAAWFRRVRFSVIEWPDGSDKGSVLAEFFRSFFEQYGTRLTHKAYNSVAFLDFDNVDKKSNLHRYIVRRAEILRCFPLDSKACNSIQLADILLGSSVRGHSAPLENVERLQERWVHVDAVLNQHLMLTVPDFSGSECRTYLAAYAQSRLRQMAS